MSARKCTVRFCGKTSGRMFTFPNPITERERFQEWISASGNAELLKVPKDKIVQRTICSIHFEEKYFLAKRLSKSAKPTLYLPERIDGKTYKIDTPTEINLPEQPKNVETDRNLPEPLQGLLLKPDFRAQTEFRYDESSTTDVSKTIEHEISEHTEERTFLPSSTLQHTDKIFADSACNPVISNTQGVELNSIHKSFDAAAGIKRKRPIDDDDGVPQLKSQVKKQKVSILQYFNKSTQQQLSERDKKLYNFVVRLSKSARQLTKRNKSVTMRLHHAEKMLKDGSWDVLNELPETIKNFIISHIRNAGRNKYNRRFTLHDKLSALAVYKRSPTAYRQLLRMFWLPSVETLRKLIQKIHLKPGICDHIFENLRNRTDKLDSKSKCCILIVDEMSLDAALLIDQSKGTVHGFCDDGVERKPEIADHAAVWMLRGIHGNRPWKQPIVYSYCQSSTPAESIQRMYTEIVRRVHSVGLRIVASVCDQGGTNAKAMRQLIQNSKRNAFQKNEELRHDVIVIDNYVIIPLFDPPHLLKCVRNNLLTKNLHFMLKDGKKRIAKWSHIETAYYIDQASGVFRTMPKLTDYHVIPSKIKKMRVAKCAQVLSRTVGSIVSLMSRMQAESIDKKKKMPAEGEDTAHLLLFFNDLFDSVNGGCGSLKSKENILRSMVSTESDHCSHEDTWNDAIQVIKGMTFEKRRPGDRMIPEVLKNWVLTLQNFKLLRKTLKDLGFKQFSPRAFNQDPLENFFGQIRQHGRRNIRPTCSAFESYYKTLLINSFSYYSNQCNCEEDESSGFLSDLTNFLDHSTTEASCTPLWELPALPDSFNLDRSITDAANADLDAFVTKSVLRQCEDCVVCCMNVLLSNSVGDMSNLHDTLVEITNICGYFVPKVAHLEHFVQKIAFFVLQNIDFQFEKCEHTEALTKEITNNYVRYFCEKYFTLIRAIMKGNPLPSNPDELMLLVNKYCKKGTRNA